VKGREPFGYVVGIDGSKITLNLKDTHRGHFAAHRDGISAVTEINHLFGVEDGTRILVLKVISLNFVEPKEVHKGISPKTRIEPEPLRQLNAVVVGYIERSQGVLKFIPDSLVSPALGAEAFPLSEEEISAIFSTTNPNFGIVLGYNPRSGMSIEIDLNFLLSKHVAVLGSTGHGKSCFTASIIQQILKKFNNPRIVIFDINGEFLEALVPYKQQESNLKYTEIGTNFKIPYYALGRYGLQRLLLPSERTQRPALNFALDHLPYVKWFPEKKGTGLVDDDSPCFFDDCRSDGAQDAWDKLQELRLRPEKKDVPAQEWPHFGALACLVAESYSLEMTQNGVRRSDFRYGNISPLINRIHRLIDDPLFNSVIDINGGTYYESEIPLSWQKESQFLIDYMFGKKETEWKAHIINLRKLPHDLMPFILGALLELYASELFRRGQNNSYPTLLILEEAHHYFRQSDSEEYSSEYSAYERLAKEGRKFGLSLWVSTQRPSELSPTVLSQCGTWIVFRLTSENDLKKVASAGEWVERLELNRIAGLPKQQAIVFGVGVPVPVRIITPDANPIPRSEDPDFTEWNIPKETP